MKKYPAISGGANSSRLSFLLLAPLVCCLPLRAAEVRSAPPEPKTHALFMGADISVEQNHAIYRVLDVQSGGFIIKVDGKEERVTADWANLVVKVDRTLKLTDTFAVSEGFEKRTGLYLGQ